MLFNSFEFLIFFPIVTILYFVIPKKAKYLWLLAASYYFYMCWNPYYVLLILFSTVATWICAILLEKWEKHKKWIVGLCVGVNICILIYFKYANFFLQNISGAAGKLGIAFPQIRVDVLLPVGISFYTFQALGYIIDVYRKEIPAQRNFFKYALFVSFFPQLVAGPIERSRNLLKDIEQIPQKKLLDYDRITGGLMMMLYGMFLKLVIADRISTAADFVFQSPGERDSLQLIIGMLCFTLQIYCDFSGYSTIAIGSAKVMGFTLMENFNTPYFALTIQDFWRRWHISLSTWFRDYLYIPLGGSRCSRFRKYCNLMITFLVSGLWHGAGWHFVAWGGLHGAYQIAGDLTKKARKKLIERLHLKEKGILVTSVRRLVTFILVAFAWIFFRADNLRNALVYIKNMLSLHFSVAGWTELCDNNVSGMTKWEWLILVAAIALMLVFGLARSKKELPADAFLQNTPLPVRWFLIYALFFAVLIFGKYGPEYSEAAFLYFQF